MRANWQAERQAGRTGLGQAVPYNVKRGNQGRCFERRRMHLTARLQHLATPVVQLTYARTSQPYSSSLPVSYTSFHSCGDLNWDLQSKLLEVSTYATP